MHQAGRRAAEPHTEALQDWGRGVERGALSGIPTCCDLVQSSQYSQGGVYTASGKIDRRIKTCFRNRQRVATRPPRGDMSRPKGIRQGSLALACRSSATLLRAPLGALSCDDIAIIQLGVSVAVAWVPAS